MAQFNVWKFIFAPSKNSNLHDMRSSPISKLSLPVVLESVPKSFNIWN